MAASVKHYLAAAIVRETKRQGYKPTKKQYKKVRALSVEKQMKSLTLLSTSGRSHKGRRMITAKQKSARRKNIAIARATKRRRRL